MELTLNEYTLSTDKARIDLPAVHAFLTRSYWAKGISKEKVQRSIDHSLCFGVYRAQEQVGFARVVSDFTHFAYLADVFVLEAHRGKGLSKWLVQSILAYPELRGLRRWMLATKDAHGLYRHFGFTALEAPERFMQYSPPCSFGATAHLDEITQNQ